MQLKDLAHALAENPKDLIEAMHLAPSDSPYNWLGLAEGAAFLATRENRSREDAISWGQVSLTAYERSRTDASQDSVVGSAMILRAALIRRFGCDRNLDPLNGELIERWFFEAVTRPREEVEEMALKWRDAPIEQRQDFSREALLMMRRIKNRLGPVCVLLGRGCLIREKELGAWCILRDMLP